MAEAGPFWPGSCVGLEMVFNLWEVKQQDMQQQMQFRLALLPIQVSMCIHIVTYNYDTGNYMTFFTNIRLLRDACLSHMHVYQILNAHINFAVIYRHFHL